MNILITGADGFIGRQLVKSFNNTLHSIYSLTHKDQDITQPFELKESFDCVFHLAACNLTNVGKTDSQTYYKVNVQGTENVIRAVNTKHFVLMSSALVYKKEGKDVDETSPIEPQSDYAKSKWEAEEVCQKYFTNDQLTVVRSVNVVGTGQAEKAVFPVFFKKALNNELIELIHPKDALLQFLYMDDVVEAFGILLEKRHGCGVINFSPEEMTTLGSLAEGIIKRSHSQSAIKVVENKETIFSKIISRKAKDLLGWQAKTSLEDMINFYYKSL